MYRVEEHLVRRLKVYLRKVKGEEDVFRHMVIMWTVTPKNEGRGFSPNQLVFGRNLFLPNLMGKKVGSGRVRRKNRDK